MEQNLTLYNKNRPRKLSDLIGNDSLKKGLVKNIRENKIPNLQFWSGRSGAGKTTTILIWLKMITCPHLDENFNPCNECKYCQSIDANDNKFISHYNGAEIGVTELNEIKSKVRSTNLFHPRKYQIIWIDEVQALKSGATFDNLLVETENAKGNVFWILSSMNPEQVPFALTSRLKPMTVESPSVESICESLYKVATQEGVSIDGDENKEAVLFSIASNSNASYREALTTLETVISDNLWTLEELLTLGFPDEKSLIEICNMLLVGNVNIYKHKLNAKLVQQICWTLTSALKATQGFELERWQQKKLTAIKRVSEKRLQDVLSLLIEAQEGYYFNSLKVELTISKIISSAKELNEIDSKKETQPVNIHTPVTQPTQSQPISSGRPERRERN